MREYKNVVYISHPSGGQKENTDRVEKLIIRLHEEFPDYLFVSPIHSFGFMYDKVDYVEGLEMCLWLLDSCDCMWVFGDIEDSVGCNAEIAYCQNNKIPYIVIGDKCAANTTYLDKKCLQCSLVDMSDEWLRCSKNKLQKIYNGIVTAYNIIK